MNTGELIIYQNTEGNIKIDVRLEEETVWLSQAQIALLFGKGRTTVTEHVANIFKEGELDEKVVCRNFRQVRMEGKRYQRFTQKQMGKMNYNVPSRNTVMVPSRASGTKQIMVVEALAVVEALETTVMSKELIVMCS